MREIVFKFIGLGYKNYYQASIKVLDNNKNIIYEGTTYNAKIKLCLKENTSYILIARIKNNEIKKVIYINNRINKFIFSFYNYRIITFLLRDYYYNLPIKKGELILWQK